MLVLVEENERKECGSSLFSSGSKRQKKGITILYNQLDQKMGKRMDSEMTKMEERTNRPRVSKKPEDEQTDRQSKSGEEWQIGNQASSYVG